MIESFIKATPTLPWPEPSPTSSVAPIPTVVPGSDPIFQVLHDTGKRTLWVVTVLMGISSLVFYVLGARVPINKRVFHVIVALASTISFIVYLALATGQGMDWKLDILKEHNKHVPNTTQEYYRQILWLRYVLWFLTEPLGLISLSLLSGLPGAHLLIAIAADFIMLGSGILGTYAGHSSRRWVWFTISAIGYLTTVYHISVHGSRAASNKDVHTKRFFGTLSGVMLFVKLLYPVALAAGALALKINVDVETILFAVYDIFSQGILGYWLLIAHDGAPGITLNVDGFWSHGLGNEGAIRISEEDGA